jgi:sporulation protein YlmC with PRC-barrel domain
MGRSSIWLGAIFFAACISVAAAACNVSDAKLEEAILQKPELRDPANRRMVLDLRALRDAALVLWSYGRHDDCEQVLANIRELLAEPSMGTLGGSDEDEADQQLAASDPMVRRGGEVMGRRHDKDAKPLLPMAALFPGVRVDEILGKEVRTSDDKIIGEVRNIVLGNKDRGGYLIVASGGFFVPGKDSLVVPMEFVKVTQERDSYFLSINDAKVKTVPLMPDREYRWLSDTAWRKRNDALFAGK